MAIDPEDFKRASSILKDVLQTTGHFIVGQENLRKKLLIGLLTEGHLLLEGVPGLGKTLSITSLAGALDASFKRIQFTPDLLPSDLVGTEIYLPQEAAFTVRKGPIFANIILADEINRAPAKVQSALLETMQERQVTIGDQTFALPRPFLVLATQNPLEQEGTYPLPEAQVDRFMMKILVEYPEAQEEYEMLELLSSQTTNAAKRIEPCASIADVEFLCATCRQVYADERIMRYIVDLVSATRPNGALGKEGQIELGASPRASISLLAAARADALFEGENFVVPQHVKNVAREVLRHRIVPSYEAEIKGLSSEDIITMVLEQTEVP